MSNSTITPWVVGNWKMNPMHADALKLIEEFKLLLQQEPISQAACHIGVSPVSIALTNIQAHLLKSEQNLPYTYTNTLVEIRTKCG